MKKKHSNVVAFPGLKQRLMQKAFDAVASEQFELALSYFQQLGDEKLPYDAGVARVVALMETGRMEEARSQCFYLLTESSVENYDLMDIYLGILVHCNQFAEAAEIAQTLIDSPNTPVVYQSAFRKYVQYPETSTPSPSPVRLVTAEDSTTDEEDWTFVDQISHVEAERYIEAIESFLMHPQKHPILKTTLLEILQKQGVKKQVNCEKFGMTMSVSANELLPVFEQSLFHEVLKQLEDHVEFENPTLHALMAEQWRQLVSGVYPFPLPFEDGEVWGAAIHYISACRNGLDMSIEGAAVLYQSAISDIEEAVQYIQMIEEKVFGSGPLPFA
ncbi:hypothetical protein G4V62_11285 [Bacillaceae bacterium SIJ1]|uniref:hypothetical protein n=1 Tax=Litoribacterium kuwaitense TaxID=1398745 RepID=UPI0013EBDAC1|nr:hypothetical protein [Litoribacterium kuwaitense]NGP45512.1 hypothetical protein [Litoribacterium kuwaitense]